jgi:uncharacterized protein YacL
VDLVLVRVLFVLIVAIACYFIQPFGRSATFDAGLGAVIGLAVIVFEWRLRLVSLKRLIGAAIGSILGIIGAYLFAMVIRTSIPEGHTQSFLQIMVMLLLMAYVGLIVGANKGDLLNLARAGWHLRRREAVEEELQDSGYQRHHRWPDRRHRRNRASSTVSS